MVAFPHLTEADPRVSAEGSIDPLGTSAIAESLAVRMVPGVRERQRHPRFLTAMAVAHLVCDRFDEDAVASDGVSAPWQVYEWHLVEGLVRTSNRSDLSGLAGQDKVRSAMRDGVPLSAKRYLKTPTVFGFHGVYRTLARQVELECAEHLAELGYELASVWADEQNLPGFVGSGGGAGGDLRRMLRDAVADGLKRGATARSAGWRGWTFFRDHLSLYDVGRREARVITRALLDPAAGHRAELLNFLVGDVGAPLWRRLSEERFVSERAFHSQLRAQASPEFGKLLDAIDVYERFSRLLEDAFDDCLTELSRAQRRVDPSELASLPGVERAAARLADHYPEVRDRLDCFGQARRFVDSFDGVAERLPAADWVQRLLEHHRRVQQSKPPNGKAPWFDRFDDGTCMIRAAYIRDAPGRSDDEYVHAYRTASLWSFANDLRMLT